MAGSLGSSAKRAVKRAMAATPYRWHALLPTMAPAAPPLIDKWDRVSQRRAPVRTLADVAGEVAPSEIEHHLPCPGCGSERLRLRYRPSMGSQSYRVAQCSDCGLLYRCPAVRPERVKDLYSTGTYADFLDGDYGDQRQDLYVHLLDQFAPRFDEGGGRAVLDFGCGTGRFMDVATESGFDAYGVDLAQDALDRAAERFGADRVALDPSKLASTPANGFDLITMWSVMAHIAEPHDLLAQLCEMIRPGGYLLIYTVNATSLQRRAFGSRWNGFTHNHLIFWDRTNLERALIGAGFSDVEFRPPRLIAPDSTDFSPRLIKRHHRAIERYDGANMMLALAQR